MCLHSATGFILSCSVLQSSSLTVLFFSFIIYVSYHSSNVCLSSDPVKAFGHERSVGGFTGMPIVAHAAATCANCYNCGTSLQSRACNFCWTSFRHIMRNAHRRSNSARCFREQHLAGVCALAFTAASSATFSPSSCTLLYLSHATSLGRVHSCSPLSARMISRIPICLAFAALFSRRLSTKGCFLSPAARQGCVHTYDCK